MSFLIDDKNPNPDNLEILDIEYLKLAIQISLLASGVYK